MLDAAAELVAERGYESATTSRIAERAGVSVGSLYQFFPDRHAVLRAVSQRNLDRFGRRLAECFPPEARMSWAEAVTRIYHAYVGLCREDQHVRALRFGDFAGLHLLEEERTNDDVVAARLVALLVRHAGATDSEELRRAVLGAVVITDHLVRLAYRLASDGHEEVIADGQRTVLFHLDRHLAGADGRTGDEAGSRPE
jgi:AcrR family transcriptional regulator